MSEITMIPLGYMRKKPMLRPDFLENQKVKDIYSVASCQGGNFADNWIDYWKHNGYWFYNSPDIISVMAEDSLASCCNAVANLCPLNEHCLFDGFEEAKQALISGIYHDAEPGPYRILAVYLIEKQLLHAN